MTSESTHLPKDPQLTASLQEGFVTNSCTCQMLLIRVATCSALNFSNKAWKVFMNLGSTSLTAKLSLSAELRKQSIEIPGTWVPPSRRQAIIHQGGNLLSNILLQQGSKRFRETGFLYLATFLALKFSNKALKHFMNLGSLSLATKLVTILIRVQTCSAPNF